MKVKFKKKFSKSSILAELIESSILFSTRMILKVTLRTEKNNRIELDKLKLVHNNYIFCGSALVSLLYFVRTGSHECLGEFTDVSH